MSLRFALRSPLPVLRSPLSARSSRPPPRAAYYGIQYPYLHEFDDVGQAWLREDFCERLRRAHACGKDGKGTEGEI
jgi:hypothetical protein